MRFFFLLSALAWMFLTPAEIRGVSWVLCPAGTLATDSSGVHVPAGTYGEFFFDPLSSPCARPLIDETIAFYPAPATPGPAESPCCRADESPSFSAKGFSVAGAAIEETPPKCRPEDYCSQPSTSIKPPWIAVVDWNNWHGDAVSWTIRSSTDLLIQPVLLPLEPILPGSRGISDVEVLARIAEIAEIVEKGTPPPLTVNMSFGRLRVTTDPFDAGCAGSTLACQISKLLHHVTQLSGAGAHPTVVLAAAGNHQRALFPASLEHVLAVGSLDTAAFTGNGAAEPTWETPPLTGPNALMPGAGICLQRSGPGLGDWPVPGGSSFAVGIQSGWLAEAMLYHKPQDLRPHLRSSAPWAPLATCSTRDCLRLFHDGKVFHTPSNRASRVVYRAIYEDVSTCDPKSGSTIYAKMEPGAVLDPKIDSLVDLVAGRHRPAPDPDPCVPCSLPCQIHVVTNRGTPPLHSRDRSLVPFEPARESPSAVEKTRGTYVELDIDLHASWSLPPGMDLERLYVRIESELYSVNLSPSQLHDLASGNAVSMVLWGEIFHPSTTDQPSLVWVLRLKDPQHPAGLLAWDSTPLLLQF